MDAGESARTNSKICGLEQLTLFIRIHIYMHASIQACIDFSSIPICLPALAGMDNAGMFVSIKMRLKVKNSM